MSSRGTDQRTKRTRRPLIDAFKPKDQIMIVFAGRGAIIIAHQYQMRSSEPTIGFGSAGKGNLNERVKEADRWGIVSRGLCGK